MNGALVSLFEYKAWADKELHAALHAFNALKHPDAFQAMLHTLDHINVVDRIFQGHLTGSNTTVSQTTNSDETPNLQQLQETVSTTDAWYLEYVASLCVEDLKQDIAFTFTDCDKGTMSREEMLLHVITHGGYHRGSAGQILEDLGVNSPPDSLTKFLHRREPERRVWAVAGAGQQQ